MKLITIFKDFIKVIKSYRWQVNANKQIENCLNQRKTRTESAKIDKSRTEIIIPINIRNADGNLVVFTETQIYPVLPKSPAALYLWGVCHDGPCKVSINKDGYIYLAEKAEIPRC